MVSSFTMYLLIRNKSPPLKFDKRVRILDVILNEKNKSYDQLNNYDFIIRYFMKIGVDTNFEKCIEITKKIFEELNDKGEVLQESKIEIFRKYNEILVIIDLYKPKMALQKADYILINKADEKD